MEQKDFEMSREKQIEEMAVEFARINCNPKGCYSCNLCDEYGSLELSCEDYVYYRKMAETFYNAGYRKQSEGEWRSELVKKCDWKGKKHDYYQPNSCSLCHEAVLKRTAYCPNCGAKMKGGAE